MSNETDLEWLVRETEGVWPDDATGIAKSGDFVMSAERYMQVDDGCHWFTKSKYMERKAELQKKPSWESAPEWAHWLGQDQDAVWYWHGEKPEAKGEDVNGQRYWMSHGISDIANRGVLLGDWRDTLEKRPYISVTGCTVISSGSVGVTVGGPADLSEQAVTARLQEATDNVLSAVPELKSDRFKFDQFTSIEDNQEQDMKQDNGWFERGELPPIGTVCEYTLGANAPWYQCEIKYVIRDDGVVMKRIPCGSEQYCGLLHKHQVSFRPILTEREKAIDEIKYILGLSGSFIDAAAARFYDAGYRKEVK